jgi:hypothetical protein
MSETKQNSRRGRREFLKLASLGTITGGAFLAMGGKPAEAEEKKPEQGGGYRETEHVKTYYRLARF